MASLFPEKFCAVSSVDPRGSVRFDCLDASTGAAIRITASSAQEADLILSGTFLWLAVTATSLSLLLMLPRILRASAPFAGRMKERAKTALFGSQSISEDSGLYLLDSEEDWFH